MGDGWNGEFGMMNAERESLFLLSAFRIHNSAFGGIWTALGLTVALCGCRRAGPGRSLDLIPTRDAAQAINANAAKLMGTVRASGSVDGYFTTAEGRRRNYHVDGTLFYLAPCYFRFDLKSLGDRQILLGSNAEYFWFYSKHDDSYYCGHQDSYEDIPEEVPVRPDQVIDALALSPLDNVDSGVHNSDDSSRFRLRKEYWGDRES